MTALIIALVCAVVGGSLFVWALVRGGTQRPTPRVRVLYNTGGGIDRERLRQWDRALGQGEVQALFDDDPDSMLGELLKIEAELNTIRLRDRATARTLDSVHVRLAGLRGLERSRTPRLDQRYREHEGDDTMP